MINTEKYNKVLDAGLLLDHFALLCCIRDKQSIVKNKRIAGFQNLLTKKGYIDNSVLTDKGKELIGEEILSGFSKSIAIIEKMENVESIDNTETVKKVKEDFDYADWVIKLYSKCKAKLLELTGKRQVRDTINGKAYPFLPNSTDLGRVILRAVQAYNLDDFDKIERSIILYIERCAKTNSWFPILQYYIMKNGASTMVTEIETMDEPTTNDDSIVNI
jgi:hypothetical protein